MRMGSAAQQFCEPATSTVTAVAPRCRNRLSILPILRHHYLHTPSQSMKPHIHAVHCHLGRLGHREPRQLPSSWTQTRAPAGDADCPLQQPSQTQGLLLAGFLFTVFTHVLAACRQPSTCIRMCMYSACQANTAHCQAAKHTYKRCVPHHRKTGAMALPRRAPPAVTASTKNTFSNLNPLCHRCRLKDRQHP
jgi:hypothetical protein